MLLQQIRSYKAVVASAQESGIQTRTVLLQLQSYLLPFSLLRTFTLSTHRKQRSRFHTSGCQTNQEVNGVTSIAVGLIADVVVLEDDEGLVLIVLLPLDVLLCQITSESRDEVDERLTGSLVRVTMPDEVDRVSLHSTGEFQVFWSVA